VNAAQAAVLGLVQGLTEFLPISSTAHLRVVPAFLGWDDPGTAFTAVVQLGTTVAVLLFFRRDLWRIASTWARSLFDPSLRGSVDARFGWYIGLGTIPIGLAGLAFKDQIETGARNLTLIASALIVLGLVLLLAERVGRRERGLDQVGARDALVIGGAQALALVPGVSRSGSTLSAGLFLGMERAAAARYSFLLSTPAIVLSAALELPEIGSGDGPGAAATVLATVVAFVSGYAAIGWLLRFLATRSTLVFVVYRVALGVLVLSLVAGNAID
jgi:undecaprenyl-diphosphatase